MLVFIPDIPQTLCELKMSARKKTVVQCMFTGEITKSRKQKGKKTLGKIMNRNKHCKENRGNKKKKHKNGVNLDYQGCPCLSMVKYLGLWG